MRKSLVLHESQLQPLKELSFEDKGRIFEAIIQYQFSNSLIDLPPVLQMAFKFIRNQIDIDNQKYDAICERNRNNGSKGGRPSIEIKPSGFFGLPENPNEPKKAENGNGNGNEERGGITKRFSPPEFAEFESYFLANNFSAELAKRAFNHYSVANWKDSTGKPVKNWRQKCQSVWFKPENRLNGQRINAQQKSDKILLDA